MGTAIIVNIALGVVCALIAQGRGRHPVGWFLLGALFPILAIILLVALPNVREQEARLSALSRENRRLREQLRLDRQVSDQRHHQTLERLHFHDRALGVDPGPEPLAAATSLLEEKKLETAAPELPPIGFDTVAWYVANEGGQQGPMHFEMLKSLWMEGRVRSDTYCWSYGMAAWAPVRNVSGLLESLDA